MNNFEALNDTNYAIPIVAANVVGQTVPLPSADTFTVTGDTTGLFAIGTLSDGKSPALLIQAAGHALVQAVTATVADADGLMVATLTVDVVEDLNPSALMLDVADAEATVVTPPAEQQAPGTAPGQGQTSASAPSTAATVPGGVASTPAGAGQGSTVPPGIAGAASSSNVGVSSNTGQPVPAAPAASTSNT